MYRELSKIKSVSLHNIFSDVVLLNYNKQFAIFDTSRLSVTIINPQPYIKLISFGNRCFLEILPKGQFEKTIELDLTDKKIKDSQIESLLLRSNIEGSKVGFVTYKEDAEQFGIVDLEINEICWKKNGCVDKQLIHQSKYYRTIKPVIFCYDLLNGLELWSFDLSILPTYLYQAAQKQDEFDKFIGVANKLLWLSTKGNRIISVDSNTGIMVHYIEWKKEEGYFFVPRSSEATLSESTLHIYLLSAFYVVIDAFNATILYKQKTEELDPRLKGCAIVNTKLFGDLLTFSASPSNRSQVKYIGILNVINTKVEWFYEMSFDSKTFIPAGQVPQLAGNKLYILDSENTLHVFEKE